MLRARKLAESPQQALVFLESFWLESVVSENNVPEIKARIERERVGMGQRGPIGEIAAKGSPEVGGAEFGPQEAFLGVPVPSGMTPWEKTVWKAEIRDSQR